MLLPGCAIGVRLSLLCSWKLFSLSWSSRRQLGTAVMMGLILGPGLSEVAGSKPFQQDKCERSHTVSESTEDHSTDDGTQVKSRFSESDLQAITELVGLETLTSRSQHCGSSSLYLFEQLTALDRCGAIQLHPCPATPCKLAGSAYIAESHQEPRKIPSANRTIELIVFNKAPKVFSTFRQRTQLQKDIFSEDCSEQKNVGAGCLFNGLCWTENSEPTYNICLRASGHTDCISLYMCDINSQGDQALRGIIEVFSGLCSLDMEGRVAGKRRRARHQHFWRNTDKLDSKERVYIPTSSVTPALRKKEPVNPKLEISPDERTNAWTVCLTTQGVVSYLNKRISPLGKNRNSLCSRASCASPAQGLSDRPYNLTEQIVSLAENARCLRDRPRNPTTGYSNQHMLKE